MPIYTVHSRTGLVKENYRHSPVIVLETDAVSEAAIPGVVRSAADRVASGDVSALRNSRIPNRADGVIVWLEGEQLLQGNAASVRRDIHAPGRRTFVAVHLPCFVEMDLITIQPRWFAAGRQHDYWNFDFRVGGSTRVSQQALSALQSTGEPWAQLSLALLADEGKSGCGVDALVRMWENNKQLPSAFAALVLRNLSVLMIRQNELAKAEQFLDLGMKAYPGYAELPYLRAVLCFHQRRGSQAAAYVQRCRVGDRGFLGSGGESSYRADWLAGLLAFSVGNQRVAFEHFCSGMISRPVFAPSVEELLKLRLPPNLVERRRWELCSLVRREPQFLERVFDFLLLHRAFPAARHLIETLPLPDDAETLLRDRLEAAMAPFGPRHGCDTGKPGLMLVGPFLEHSSLSRINREIGASLLRSPHLDVCLEPSASPVLTTQMVANGALLEPAFFRHPEHLELTIRHQWPSDFCRPPRGKLAVILPWEFGAAPRVWIHQIEQSVDELWVPSRFVRDVFVRCGVASDRVQVIPNGVDPAVFTLEGTASRPQGCRGFTFLFVGGAIRRKGVDLLLEAYREAFDPGDDVTLVINVLGSSAAYQHNTLTRQLQAFAHDPTSPHLQVLTEEYDDPTLASLYRGCDAFVLPYRGEGFGMPLLEAMACGKPVITTAQGPSQEFCSSKTAYLVPAREVEVPDELPPLGEMAGEFTWFEPDVAELALAMRHVYRNREEAARRGRLGAKQIRADYSWSRITSMYLDRITSLLGDQTAKERRAVTCGRD